MKSRVAMKEFLKTKGFKMTPQRELIFRSFFEMGKHVSVEELYEKVHQNDRSIGYSTVWRNLKVICKVGLAEEVNLGDGVTRYDRVTREPHGHLFCQNCKKLVEFEIHAILPYLVEISEEKNFRADSFKIEVTGLCEECQVLENKKHERVH